MTDRPIRPMQQELLKYLREYGFIFQQNLNHQELLCIVSLERRGLVVRFTDSVYHSYVRFELK